MTEDQAAAADHALTYSYRPSLLGAAWIFRLTETGLEFEAGRRSGRLAYRDITRVRLSFKPVSMQTNRYLTEIWAEGAPKLEIVSSSWKSMMEQERLDKPYSAFIAELHRRIAASDAQTRFEHGGNPLRYWPGLVVFIGVSIGLAFLVVRALQSDTMAGAAFIAAFMALFLWQGGNFFRRNRPGVYRAEAPPAELLP